MVRVSVFKPCTLDYPQHEKPVRYTEDFLKEIASSTVMSDLVDAHYGKTIGQVSNLSLTDGELFLDVPDEYGESKFSPSFENLTLVDEGDYFLATKGSLVEVAITKAPRLDNSDDGGSNMSKEGEGNNLTNEYLAKEVERLNKEIAKKDLQIERNKEKLDKYNELEKEVKTLRESEEANKKLLDEQKPIVESFKKFQEEEHEKLLETASNGNAELKEKYAHFSNDDLKLIIDTHVEDQPARGAGASNAPGLNEGDGETDEEAERKARNEAVEKMFSDLNFKEE